MKANGGRHRIFISIRIKGIYRIPLERCQFRQVYCRTVICIFYRHNTVGQRLSLLCPNTFLLTFPFFTACTWTFCERQYFSVETCDLVAEITASIDQGYYKAVTAEKKHTAKCRILLLFSGIFYFRQFFQNGILRILFSFFLKQVKSYSREIHSFLKFTLFSKSGSINLPRSVNHFLCTKQNHESDLRR